MKTVIILISLVFFACKQATAQFIHPPVGFKKIKADGIKQFIDRYEKDGCSFESDIWAGPRNNTPKTFDTYIAEYLHKNYNITISKDKGFVNGVYYGVAHYRGKYVLIVLHKEWLYKLSSRAKDANFGKYCTWLLTEAKNTI